MAAIALGRIATPAAERILQRNLPKTSDDAFSEVLRSRGRIGGPEALKAIESLALPARHPGAATAAYAATLIAHRLGLPGHRLPSPAAEDLLPAPGEGARPIEFGPADAETARAVLGDLAQQPYGIGIDPATLTQTRCSGEINVICPNRELLGPGAATLARRDALLALVALRSAETGAYSVSYVVLSHPAEEGALAVTARRCSGRLALAGTARLSGGRMEFDLRAVRRPGARAVSLQGTLHDGRVGLGEALSSATVVRRRVPARRAP